MAEVIVFECEVTRTWRDGTIQQVRSRTEITTETLAFVEYHYQGDTPRLAVRGKLERLDATRVTFADSPGMTSYIDRTTGETYWRDERRGVEDRGTCKEVS
jgi:hypothetical protein